MTKIIPFDLNTLESLSTKYDTPYYLYDGDKIKERAKNYIESFKKYFPDFKQFYAVKACPNPSILEILTECGMNFDCSSPEEVEIVNMVNNVTGTNREVMYTSNYTSTKDIDNVLQYKNITMNFDDIDGFYNYLETESYKKSSNILSTVCFRYNPILNDANVDIKSNNFAGTNTKFGMTKENLIYAYNFTKRLNKEVKFGIHTMCASNQLDINYWKELIDNVFEIVHELYLKYSIKIEFINIGGGFGIPYRETQKEIDLNELVLLLHDSFVENTAKFNLPFQPTLYTECGRYITGPYGYLISRCQSIKYTDTEIFYGLDANMANLMRPGMYDAYHHVSVPRLCSEQNTITANVVGTLCENNDWFCKKRELPAGIQKGDLFVIHDCGAHAFSMGFNYNSKLRSCELLAIHNKFKKIRDRETFDTLFNNTYIYQNVKLGNIDYPIEHTNIMSIIHACIIVLIMIPTILIGIITLALTIFFVLNSFSPDIATDFVSIIVKIIHYVN